MRASAPPAALVSPKGRPVALSPLLGASAAPTPGSSAPATPMLTWPPEGALKFSRSVSGASTVVPDEPSEHHEALRDGPALTMDGRALDLDGGLAIHFSHDPRLASGYEQKKCLKDRARLLRATRRLEAARRAEASVDAGDACALDAAGVLHGGLPAAPAAADAGARQKLFRRKRLSRRGPCRGREVACAGPDGRHFLFLSPPAPGRDEERLRQLRRGLRWEHAVARRGVPEATPRVFETLCVDVFGRIHLDAAQ